MHAVWTEFISEAGVLERHHLCTRCAYAEQGNFSLVSLGAVASAPFPVGRGAAFIQPRTPACPKTRCGSRGHRAALVPWIPCLWPLLEP